LRFFSRLPLPVLAVETDPHGQESFARALRMAPFAGAALGFVAGAVLVAASGLGEPAPVAALLALTAGVLLSGAMHEDGLADVADGFGGGASRERKLEIMRDSRLGAYGATALVLSLGLRAAALAALAASPGRALAVLVASGAVSRAAALAPLVLLPSARGDGLGQSAGGRSRWPRSLSAFCRCFLAFPSRLASSPCCSPLERCAACAPWRAPRSAARPAMSPARRSRSRNWRFCVFLPGGWRSEWQGE
jgi:adenosylcobinamide-GDP ribazoletransferase